MLTERAMQTDRGDGNTSPRPVIRGHQIQNEGENAFVDWLSFTLSPGRDGVELTAADWARELSGMAELPALDRGNYGYDAGFRLPGNGLVMFNARRPEMGVHLSLPAGALAQLPYGPGELIAKVKDAGGRFTRLDTALDSHEVEYATIEAACKRGDIVTRADEISYGNTQRRRDGGWVYGGAITRIGSRSSRRFVRIYDKAAQQKLTDGSVWTRCEVEFKSEAAQMAASHILAGKPIQSLIFSTIDFRDCVADSNKSRCPQLDWWAAWIGIVDKVSFAIEKVEKTIKQVYEWVQRQVAPSLAFLDGYWRESPSWLTALCDGNKHRIPPARQQLIDAKQRPLQALVSELAPARR